jgi:hypothetical protein
VQVTSAHESGGQYLFSRNTAKTGQKKRGPAQRFAFAVETTFSRNKRLILNTCISFDTNAGDVTRSHSGAEDDDKKIVRKICSAGM